MNMVTDRTPLDVARWKELRDKGWARMSTQERKEWLGEIVPTVAATKGMYTHNDLNRVEGAVEVILELFRSAGYKPPELSVKTDWTYSDTIRATDMERYLGNIAALREFLIVYPNTPEAPTVDKRLDYKLANDIEKILVNVHTTLTNLMNSWYYSGEIISGEV